MVKASKESKGTYIVIAIIVVIIGIIGYRVLNAPDTRSGADKISDAINELPQGVDKASRQLEDRTPGEKLNDAAKDAVDDIKKTTNQQ